MGETQTIMLDQLHARLKALGIDAPVEWNTPKPTRNGAQWFIGKTVLLPHQGGMFYLAWFGDYARAIKEEWKSDLGPGLLPDERDWIAQAVQAQLAHEREAREKYWEEIQPEVEREWDTCSTLGTTPYLTRKKIDKLYGARVRANEHGDPILVVPMRDTAGRLWNFQRVYAQKLSAGDKFFCKGARIEGCFHLLGQIQPESTVYICEGFATAASAFMALGESQPVVAAFNAGNLASVSRALRQAFPKARLVFCADNDQFPARDGKVYHTGKRKAETAAKEVGGLVVLPHFKLAQLDGRPTDFNDLHVLDGLEAVKDQLLNGGTPEELRALAARNKKGEPTKPGEQAVVRALLSHYGESVLVQDRDVFLYREGYWRWQTPDDIKQFKRELCLLYGPQAGSRDIEAAWKTFLIHAPTPPHGVSLFSPQYFAANFRNGTLFLRPVPGGRPELSFVPHSPEHFLTNQLPFDFPGLDKLDAKNPEFEKMLDRVFEGDEDAQAKRRVLAQMYGAVLMPCYPKIFFLVGPKGSGKSTVCKLLYRLADPKNVSHVDPAHFNGFNMETMVGKLLNMDTDIDLHKPINDALVKKITDGMPFRVSRKFQTDLLAPLAPIHIFGGNDLPKSLEGATGAYERRVIILRFGAFSAERLGAGNYAIDFESQVWEAGFEGILAFAIRGLLDLAESRGHFAIPHSSKAMLHEWDERSDVLGQFLDDLAHKEVDGAAQYSLSGTARIKRKDLWAAFSSWQENRLRPSEMWSQAELYSAMRKRGFAEYKTKSDRGFVGLGASASEDFGV